jgi:hypothetical protein
MNVANNDLKSLPAEFCSWLDSCQVKAVSLQMLLEKTQSAEEAAALIGFIDGIEWTINAFIAAPFALKEKIN